MKYHGEVLDAGRDFAAVDSDAAIGPVVSLKLTAGIMMAEIFLDAAQARELSRHLSEAANTSQRL